MSETAILNPQSYELDKLIQTKCATLLTNELIEEQYLDYAKFDVLEDILASSTLALYDFNEMPKEMVIEALDLLKKENIELAGLVHQINKERQVLKEQNFKLLERLFVFENFQIEKFDKDFNRFVAKLQCMNYELSKIFLEKERHNIENLTQKLLHKDEEVAQLKNKVSMLEQRVIEGRKMLKKTILETSPPKSKNEITAQTADNTNMTSMSNFESNRLSSGTTGKESSQKLLSPTSQHDTTSDSLYRTFAHDTANRGFQKRDLSELLVNNNNNIESVSLNERMPNLHYDKFSNGLGTLEDQYAEEMERQRDSAGGMMSTRGIREVKATPKGSLQKPSLFSNNNNGKSTPKDIIKPVGPQVPTPSARVAAAGIKKEGIKSPASKNFEIQPKFRFKTEECPPEHNNRENLSLSFLLDQNVSVDSINSSAPMVSSSTAKEMENELRKKTSLVGNVSKPEVRKSVSGPMTTKNVSDSAKPKTKVAINTSPIPVKKKTPSENK